MMKRMTALLAALILTAACTCGPAFAETLQQTRGDAQGVSVFEVTSTGGGSITLRQTKGFCELVSYTGAGRASVTRQQIWGRYHIRLRSPNGLETVTDWNDSANPETCLLELPDPGLYRITVTPYTWGEYPRPVLNYNYSGWLTAPAWSIARCQGCTPVMPTVTAVTVQYLDIYGSLIMTRSVNVYPGSNQVIADAVPTGYRAIGNTLVTVWVDGNGRPSVDPVTFYVARIQPSWDDGTWGGGSQGGGSQGGGSQGGSRADNGLGVRNKVTPTGWDTQFKPETTSAQSDNRRGYESLWKLYDGSSSTPFQYTMTSGARDDNVPEFTAFFGGVSLRGIGVMNGDVSGSTRFSEYGRARKLEAVIHTPSGTVLESFTLRDSRDSDYRRYDFSRTYTNVTKVELFIRGTYNGSRYKYIIRIADLCFY